MSEEKALSSIQNKFGSTLANVFQKNKRRVYITVDKKDVPAVCRFMFENLGGRLAIATAIDTRSGMEILYHFVFPKEYQVITVKTKVKKSSMEIESIAPFLDAANWIEREMHDILGLNFTNHPDMRRILMADDWPEGDYPLRRDFKERPR
ncbi:MAG: NADH-quinone oxidoreductase subunit C [Candidatus Latescibacteria bacterium]|nr:NADH-quinone oxidoreductase subunit C [Candidatus Latescibacterota bacterium]